MMSTEFIDKAPAIHQSTKRFQLLSFFIALAFALTIHPGKAHAQIIGQLEVNIPFQFHVGNSKLPAGKYFVHQLDDSTMTSVMEISSADGSTSALFEVQSADGKSSAANSELIFDKYGDRYFLAKVYDAEDPSWMKVPESSYEKRVSQAAAEGQEHVPAIHHAQHGK